MNTPRKGKEKVVDCQEEDSVFHQEVKDFVEKLKVRNGNLYLAFLQAMSSYRTKLKEANVHINEVLTLLVDNQDLKNEFVKIMTVTDSGASSSTEKNDNEAIEKQVLCFFKKVQEKLSETSFILFMRCFYSYSNGNINKEELKNTITSMISEFPQLIAEFNLLMKNSWTKAESNQELEKSSRTENDKPMKRRRLIQSEDMKMKREDDMYELDMLLSWLKSAANYAKILSEGGREEPVKAIRKIHLKRCIERLYGDSSVEVFEILQENPKHASSVILTRLNQKIEELQIFQVEMKNIWAQLQ